MIYISLVLSFVVGFFLKKYSNFFYFLYILPGTILHELSHFVVGLLFLANPNFFSLVPKKEGDSWTLGSVSFSNTKFFNAIPVALAPILLIFFAFITYKNSLTLSIFEQLLSGFLIFQLINSSIPSSQDFNVAFSNKLGIIFYLLITTGGLLYAIQNNLFNLTFL